jgi:hypothetical protein
MAGGVLGSGFSATIASVVINSRIFPIYKKEIGSFAGLSAGRRLEKFTPVEAENWAFCQ